MENNLHHKPHIAIIILNWNGWKDTIECLESLYQISYPNYNVIVVDNDSEDESIDRIKEYAEGKITVESKFFRYDLSNKPIKIIEYTRKESEGDFRKEEEITDLPYNQKLFLIKNEENYGFAEGNNIGMRFALKNFGIDCILLLNNDTVVHPNFLTELVKTAESDKKIGIVGPKIYYYDYNGRSDVLNFTGADLILWKAKEIRYGTNEIDEGQYDVDMEVDKIEGSCMLIKKEVINDIGMLDPQFFAYWEETDFCFRAKAEGYNAVYTPGAKIWHKIAASTGGIASSFRTYYITRNTLLFISKNTDVSTQIKYIIYFLSFDLWFKLGSHLSHGPTLQTLKRFLRGVVNGIKSSYL